MGMVLASMTIISKQGNKKGEQIMLAHVDVAGFFIRVVGIEFPEAEEEVQFHRCVGSEGPRTAPVRCWWG